MTYLSSVAMDYPGNPNPNDNNYYPPQYHSDQHNFIDAFPAEFQLSDYLILDDEEYTEDSSSSQNMVSTEQAVNGATSRNCKSKCKKEVKKDKAQVAHRFIFRTKTEIEIMDDGFRWRKYGKKSVKNSPNPRNYYKCLSGGCNVKKRVERDREDSRYVMTSYDGVHNHESPCVSYCNQMPPVVPHVRSLQHQASSPHSSSSS